MTGVRHDDDDLGPRYARRPIHLSTGALVNQSPLSPNSSLPLIITPAAAGLSLTAAARNSSDTIEAALRKHGAILFRGFDSSTKQHFDDFLDAIKLNRMGYIEGATPRKALGDQVYTSTEFPPEYAIALHNELSYVSSWPMKVCFFCLVPPDKDGETPIGDVRKVYQRVPVAVRSAFEAKGWMLIRNFGKGLSLTWQQAYHCRTHEEAEKYFAAAGISYEWKGEDRLTTRQVRPAVAVHPKTHETVWFNHIAFWHFSSLEPRTRDFLISEFGVDGLPYNTYYGDGSAIDSATAAILRDAYEQETIMFPWHAGDLLMMDNMLTAHGRRPFRGPRQIIVSMGDPYIRERAVDGENVNM